jgi:hypothetical protein
MKRNEIALLILIVGGVGIVTYFALNSFLSGMAAKPVAVEVATPISATLVDMDSLKKRLFVEGSYNPTVKVTIGDQANKQPFNSTTQ